jgi:hypothetical protein
MSGFRIIEKSNYRYVTRVEDIKSNKRYWRAYLMRKKTYFKADYELEKDAAIAVDKFLIKMGLEPINILKKK